MPVLVRRRVLLCLVATVWACVFTPVRAEEQSVFPYREATTEGARLEYVQGYPVMFLAGSPEEIGRQQAALVGEQVGPLVEMPRKTLAAHGAENRFPLVAAVAAKMIENVSPDHRKELDTLQAQSGLNRDGLYVGNALVELRRMGGCSEFAVLPERSRTGELIFGRNFDFPDMGVLHRYHCILVVHPEGKRKFVSIGYPGMVGVISGINDAGLVVTTLDVYQSADRSPIFEPSGVPMAFTFRRVLEECSSVDEAERLLKEVPRTTYMNLAVADARTAVVFELTPGRVGRREATDGVVCCTNHFQLEGLRTNIRCTRIETLNEVCRQEGPLGIHEVHQALHAVHQGKMTLQTMIFEPRALRLHLAMGGAGPVSNKPLKTFELQDWLN